MRTRATRSIFAAWSGGPADPRPSPRLLRAVRRFRRVAPPLLLLGLPFFFVGGPGFYSPRSFVQGWDLGHILYFSLFTLWLLNLKRFNRRGMAAVPRRALLLALPCAAALCIECLQFVVKGRAPSLRDLGLSALGAVLVLAFQDFSDRRPRGLPLRPLVRGAALILLVSALVPFARALGDEIRALRQFPVLAEFERPDELSRWYHVNQLRLEDRVVRSGKHSARIQLSTAKISGVTLLHFPGDWRGYARLRFSVYNPLPSPLELHCRLDDRRHRRGRESFADRFNDRFTLRPGWNDLAVSLEEAAAAPRGRRMDMAHIAGFGLFVVERPQAVALYLDGVRLER